MLPVGPMVLHNFHVLRQWQVRQEIAEATPDADSTFDPFGPTVPRAAMPEMAAAADGGAPGHAKGPVGLDFLGAPRNGPPPIPAG